VKDLQDLNPFIIIGCGGGGEKFSNFEGIETVGFVDDDENKQGKQFGSCDISNSLIDTIKNTDANSVAIMLPIGAEGVALKYAVQAIDNGKNLVTSFRSLSLIENQSLLKLANEKNVVIKEIGPRLDVIEELFGITHEKSSEILPKISYDPIAPVVFVGGTSQECGKRTTTRLLGKEAMSRGLNAGVISTDELGIEDPVDLNFRAGSLSAMDVPAAILQSVKTIEKEKNPDIIFIEGQSSLTEIGNPHPRGLSAAILIGAAPNVTVLCHRPNHPFRTPRGIIEEIKAIESVEDTKVVALSLNLRNEKEKSPLDYENEYGISADDIKTNGGSKLLNAILNSLKKDFPNLTDFVK
jgi:uncharacterized NAD-dependent epimerase/dehydratase family protein